MIRHKKKTASRQIFQSKHSDAIKAAHQWPAEEVEQTFSRGRFVRHPVCHSERSEESLVVSGPMAPKLNQRCFASLNMTTPFKSLASTFMVYILRTANCNRQFQ